MRILIITTIDLANFSHTLITQPAECLTLAGQDLGDVRTVDRRRKATSVILVYPVVQDLSVAV